MDVTASDGDSPGDRTAGALLAALGEAIDARDWTGVADLLHPGFRRDYVHTGETFDKASWLSLNRD